MGWGSFFLHRSSRAVSGTHNLHTLTWPFTAVGGGEMRNKQGTPIVRNFVQIFVLNIYKIFRPFSST